MAARACFGRTESEGSLQNQGIPAGLLMGESIGIDSVLEAKRCQVRILPRCESESSQELREVLVAMHKRRIAGSRTAIWRFFARHEFTFKKKPARGGTGTG